MIFNMLQNLYSELGREISQKKLYSLVFTLICILFFISSSNTLLFNQFLIFFIISLTNIFTTLYYAKTNSLFVTRVGVKDLTLYAYFIGFLYLYCQEAETETFILCINLYYVIRLIKNFKFRFNQFEFFKFLLVLYLNIYHFRMSFMDCFIYLVFAIGFTVLMLKSRELDDFYRVNYQVNFLLTIGFGLYCVYDAGFYLSDFVDNENIINTVLTILLGVIGLHMYIHMLIRFPLKIMLFVQNQAMLLILCLISQNTFFLITMIALISTSFYIIDFDYQDEFYDPFNEVLVNNTTFNDFLNKILSYLKKQKHKPKEVGLLSNEDDFAD